MRGPSGRRTEDVRGQLQTEKPVAQQGFQAVDVGLEQIDGRPGLEGLRQRGGAGVPCVEEREIARGARCRADSTVTPRRASYRCPAPGRPACRSRAPPGRSRTAPRSRCAASSRRGTALRREPGAGRRTRPATGAGERRSRLTPVIRLKRFRMIRVKRFNAPSVKFLSEARARVWTHVRNRPEANPQGHRRGDRSLDGGCVLRAARPARHAGDPAAGPGRRRPARLPGRPGRPGARLRSQRLGRRTLRVPGRPLAAASRRRARPGAARAGPERLDHRLGRRRGPPARARPAPGRPPRRRDRGDPDQPGREGLGQDRPAGAGDRDRRRAAGREGEVRGGVRQRDRRQYGAAPAGRRGSSDGGDAQPVEPVRDRAPGRGDRPTGRVPG